MASPTSQSVRRIIATVAVTAITVTGTIYGAGLKTRQEFKQEKAAALETPAAEKIEQLETIRARYLRQRAELQSKIDRLAAKSNTASPETQPQG